MASVSRRTGACRDTRITIFVTPDGQHAETSGSGEQSFLDLSFLAAERRARNAGETPTSEELDLDAQIFLAELSSLRTSDSRSNVRTLSTDEWFERWNKFRVAYPGSWPLAEFEELMRELPSRRPLAR